MLTCVYALRVGTPTAFRRHPNSLRLHRFRQNDFSANSHRCIRPMTELNVENGASEVLESRVAKVRRCTSPLDEMEVR